MRRFAEWLPLCAMGAALLSGAGGCGAPDPPHQIQAESPPSKPTVPPAIAAVAEAALGPGARVLSFGALAQNGRQQVLAANAAGATSKNERSIRLTRAAILEQVGTKWVEVLRCDEYLKNPSGYLVGSPRGPVTSWQLEFGGNSRDHRHDLLFPTGSIRSGVGANVHSFRPLEPIR